MTITFPSTLYNIRTALLAFVLLPFLAIVILAGWYSLSNLEAKTASNMQDDIALIARAIRLPLGHALEHDQRDMIKQTLSSTSDFNRVYGVYVYDKDGQRLAGSGTEKASVQNEKAAVLASLGNEQSEFDEAGGEPVFSYFVPLTNSGERIIGLLQVTRRGKDFSRYVAEFRSQTLTVMGVSVLLLIVAVYIGYHHAVGKHMYAMRRSMQRMAEGNRQHRLDARGPAEIQVLAQGVNRMLDSIEASEQEIAEGRENEFQLKSQLYQTEKLAAIGRLAAGVAHELGTPLSAADGQAQRALRRADEQQQAVLTKIRQQLGRMTHIIRQLMNFARPNKPDRRTFAVDELVQASLAQLESHQSSTRILIKGEQPAPKLWADRLRLEQALTNLLRNAMQAAPYGVIRVSWSIKAEDCLALTVEDDGPGIPETIRERLFEPFFTTKTVGEGTGLGLAVVEAVAAEHQGRIVCDESPLGGARFQLHLPLHAGKPEPLSHWDDHSASQSARTV